MRTTNVAMYSPNSTEPVNFSLGDKAVKTKFRIRAIMGLDAEEITPMFYGFGTVSKNRFYNFGLRAREIVMRIVLRPNYMLGESFSDVRDELYRMISANRSGIITLHFNADATNVAKIEGFIIKFEVGYFNKEPEVQITIRCDDPMFRSVIPATLRPEDVVGLAALDYPNVNISDTLSTAPHGFTTDITFKSNTAALTIKDKEGSDNDWFFTVLPDGGFIPFDILHLSSEFANRSLVLERGGNFFPIIDMIQPGSVWPVIFPGENYLYFSPAANIDWTSIDYYASYWGV